MNQHIEIIQRIGQKLPQLIKQRDNLLREKEKLQMEIAHSEKDKQALALQVSTLQEQVAILKTATSDMNDKEKRDFEKRINGYIKDIDKVIAHLQV